MRLLLDTHVFLWLQTEPERLGKSFALVEDERNELIVSAASSWEMAIKYGLGKLPLPEPPERLMPQWMRAIGAQGLAIEHSHALAVGDLAPIHRDPFDRLLVAQARVLTLTVLTADPVMARYPVETIVV